MALYRSPSQTQDEFEKFSDNLELNFGTLPEKTPFLVVAIGDFNAKSESWYTNDSTTSQCNVLENITSQFGLQLIIKEPTHILDNSSSCIDLIFTSQPSLITELSVYPLLHPNCHHQVVYAVYSKFIILHNIIEKSGIIKMQILNLSDERLMDLIGRKHFPIKMLTKK